MKNVNASIITIGDELLIGQTIDTNSAWIGQELNKIGVWVKRRVAVGDVWEDIGNYYGAGAGEFNWRENQYDITLRSTPNIGDKVEILAFNGRKDYKGSFISEAKSAAKGTGDNAYIYFPIGNTDYTVRGTIPVNENNFTISGAVSEGSSYFAYDLGSFINNKNKSSFGGSTIGYSYRAFPSSAKIVYAYYSPPLDSIIYWFNKKSMDQINYTTSKYCDQ